MALTDGFSDRRDRIVVNPPNFATDQSNDGLGTPSIGREYAQKDGCSQSILRTQFVLELASQGRLPRPWRPIDPQYQLCRLEFIGPTLYFLYIFFATVLKVVVPLVACVWVPWQAVQ